MRYAGIDWADNHHDTVVIDESSNIIGSLTVDHTPEGLAKLIAFLQDFNSEDAPLACIIETNRGLLVTALLEAGLAVYPVNPKTVDRKRGAAGAKTDKIDAYLLAKTGRADLADLRQLAPDNPLVKQLRELTRDQDGLIQEQTGLLNRLTACLKTYYPVALNLFSRLAQVSTLRFLRAFPTLEQARVATEEEITQLLKKARHPGAAQVACEIYAKLRQPQLMADSATAFAKSRLLLCLVAQLEVVLEQIKLYDKEITKLFKLHPDSPLWIALPGAGKRLAPRLLAEIGDDRTRYEQPTNLQAVAGTAPVPYASGNYSRARQRHACIKPLRNVLHQFAWQTTIQEAWAAEYYQRKRSEGKTHSMAVRSLANNWVRIIHALWQKNEFYDSAKFKLAQLTHARKGKAA